MSNGRTELDNEFGNPYKEAVVVQTKTLPQTFHGETGENDENLVLEKPVSGVWRKSHSD